MTKRGHRHGQRRGAARFTLACALAFACGCAKKPAEQKAPEPEPVRVSRGNLRQQIESTGKVVPELEVEIKSKASGQVVLLPRDVSDPVRKGDLLAELDPVDEERRVKQNKVAVLASQASLHRAQARTREAATKLQRAKTLAAKDLVSSEELEEAEFAHAGAVAEEEMADAQVKGDELALADAEQRLIETKIFSPIDGVVTARQAQIGQIISSGISNVSGGTTLLSVADLSRVYVVASVDESDIGKVAVGQKVEVTADAFPGVRFPGSVVRIYAKGERVSNVVIFDVKIEVGGPDKGRLKPEMTAAVTIVASERKDVLTTPLDAVTITRDGAMVRVRAPSGEVEDRKVDLGVDDGQNVEIRSGLDEGDAVLARAGGQRSRWDAFGAMRGAPGMRSLMMRTRKK